MGDKDWKGDREKGMKKRREEKREEQYQIMIRIVTLDRMLGSRGDGRHTWTIPRCLGVSSSLSVLDSSHLIYCMLCHTMVYMCTW